MSQPEYLPIAVRGIAVPVHPRPDFPPGAPPPTASNWTFVFDTETDTDEHGEAQPLLIVPYQIYEGKRLRRKGFAFDPAALYPQELELLHAHCRANALPAPMEIDDFREFFIRYAYRFRANVVGFALAFDLPRLAHNHTAARGRFYDGFTLRISKEEPGPSIRMKKLNARAYKYEFTSVRRKRKPGEQRVRPWRGAFVDLKAAGDALLGGRHDLDSLPRALDVPVEKMRRPSFSRPFDDYFLKYAYRDVVVTSACYFTLLDKYNSLDLPRTLDKIYSEASVAKAEYARIGIRPWLEVQPFQSDLTSLID